MFAYEKIDQFVDVFRCSVVLALFYVVVRRFFGPKLFEGEQKKAACGSPKCLNNALKPPKKNLFEP